MGTKMLKKPLAILAALLSILWTNPADAAGTIAFSLSQQFDQNGHVLGGCQLYIIQAGTTSTPQDSFQDTGLTIKQPNPMSCDAFGRLPQFFLADGQIKVRLTDKFANPIFTQDNILVIGPSAGGGGGGSVDPTTVLQTGDYKGSHSTGPINGFVRCNGRTIGSAISGASERANADTSALFSFLWNNDPNLVVSSGRGANPGADFAANKTITIPDCRGRELAGLADMGNSATSVLTSTYAGCNFGLTTLGTTCGSQSHTILLTEAPTGITSAGSITVFPDGNSNHFVPENLAGANWQPNNLASIGGGTGLISPYFNGTNGQLGQTNSFSGSGTVTSNNTGGQPHSIVPPMMLITIYIKL